jgi:hypothetical protein
MSTDPETTRIVRTWLRTDEHESAESVLAAVLGRLDATPQRRPMWRAWRTTFMNGTLKLAAAGLTLAVAASVGFAVFLSRPPDPAASPLPSNPAATELAVPPPTSIITPKPSTARESLARSDPTATDIATWRTTADVLEGSLGHAPLVRLPDGRVFNVREIYDPASGSWSALEAPISGQTATLLADGRVLVTGPDSKRSTPSAEIYDPRSGTWTPTGRMHEHRRLFTTTLLRDGRVLAAGGMGSEGSYSYVASAELYDPVTGQWSATGEMTVARGAGGIHVLPGHTATLLENGMVLVAGGRSTWDANSASAELYNPASGTWTITASMNEAREFHTATLLDDGAVLVVGGGPDAVTTEFYDPASGTWSVAPHMVLNRDSHTATLLMNGDVLVVGGQNNGPVAAAEIYDPDARTWTSAGNMTTARSWHSATLLLDGSVLVTGGEQQPYTQTAWEPARSAELFALEPVP